MARNNITVITGYTAPKSEMPSMENIDARFAWIEKHIVSTHRSGKWNRNSCIKIAEQIGIVDGLSVKVC